MGKSIKIGSASVCRTKTEVTDFRGTHPGPDEIILFVEDVVEMDEGGKESANPDYIAPSGDFVLSLSLSEAKKLARTLLQLASNKGNDEAETKKSLHADHAPLLSPELEKAWK